MLSDRASKNPSNQLPEKQKPQHRNLWSKMKQELKSTPQAREGGAQGGASEADEKFIIPATLEQELSLVMSRS